MGEDRGDHCKGGSPPWELLREMGPEVSPVSPGGSPWTSSDSLKVARRGACRRWLLISACLPAAQCAFRPAVHWRLQVGARASAGGTYEWDYGHLPEAQLGTREAICKCLMVMKAHGIAAHVLLESGAPHVLPNFAIMTGVQVALRHKVDWWGESQAGRQAALQLYLHCIQHEAGGQARRAQAERPATHTVPGHQHSTGRHQRLGSTPALDVSQPVLQPAGLALEVCQLPFQLCLGVSRQGAGGVGGSSQGGDLAGCVGQHLQGPRRSLYTARFDG